MAEDIRKVIACERIERGARGHELLPVPASSSGQHPAMGALPCGRHTHRGKHVKGLPIPCRAGAGTSGAVVGPQPFHTQLKSRICQLQISTKKAKRQREGSAESNGETSVKPLICQSTRASALPPAVL